MKESLLLTNQLRDLVLHIDDVYGNTHHEGIPGIVKFLRQMQYRMNVKILIDSPFGSWNAVEYDKQITCLNEQLRWIYDNLGDELLRNVVVGNSDTIQSIKDRAEVIVEYFSLLDKIELQVQSGDETWKSEFHSVEEVEAFLSDLDFNKYIVQWEVNGDGTDWQPVPGYEEPMANNKAAAVFFMQWMEISSPLSLAEVRAAFPTSINTYYARNKGKKAYDSLIWHSTDNIHAVSESGFTVDIQKDAHWDLYPIVRNNPNNGFGLGHAPVMEGLKRNGIAMIAKMWRKADFENLLKHISDHSQDLFARVRIIPC